MASSFVTGIIYSKHDENQGPIPYAWEPRELPLRLRTIISVKTLSILMGEDGSMPESLILLPFPSIHSKGLIKLMSYSDKSVEEGK